MSHLRFQMGAGILPTDTPIIPKAIAAPPIKPKKPTPKPTKPKGVSND